MNTPDNVEQSLIEAATTTVRSRDRAGRPLPHPAWADLSASGRQALYEAQLTWRSIERQQDPDGLSGTARAVLARIGGIAQG